MTYINTIEGAATVRLRSTRSFPSGFSFRLAHGRDSSAHQMRAHQCREHGRARAGYLVEFIIETDSDEAKNLTVLPVGQICGDTVRKRLDDAITAIVDYPDGSKAILECGSLVSRIEPIGDKTVCRALFHFQDSEENVGRMTQ